MANLHREILQKAGFVRELLADCLKKNQPTINKHIKHKINPFNNPLHGKRINLPNPAIRTHLSLFPRGLPSPEEKCWIALRFHGNFRHATKTWVTLIKTSVVLKPPTNCTFKLVICYGTWSSLICSIW